MNTKQVSVRNANYQGSDASIAHWQAKADACALEIGRLRREGKCTLSALDRMEIQELVVLYDVAYDGLDRETFLATMTDDVEFRSNSFGDVDGKKAMGDWYDNFTRTFNGKRHLLTNFVIVGEGDKATMLSYLTVFERIVNTNMVGSALYYDQFVKKSGTWYLSKRLEILDPGMNETEYGQSLIRKYIASLG